MRQSSLALDKPGTAPASCVQAHAMAKPCVGDAATRPAIRPLVLHGIHFACSSSRLQKVVAAHGLRFGEGLGVAARCREWGMPSGAESLRDSPAACKGFHPDSVQASANTCQ